MKDDGIFREQAVRSRSERWNSASFLPKGVPVWCLVAGCLTFIILTLIFLLYGGYNRRVMVSGELVSEPRGISIFSTQQGYVSGQFVQPGDLISKGQTLYQIDTSKKTSSGIVSDNQKAYIERQLSTLDDIIKKTEDNRRITIASLQQQLDNYRTLMAHFRDTASKAEQGMRFMEKNLDNYRGYLSRGLINKEQLTNQMSIYYSRQNDMLNLTNQDGQFAVQIINLEANIKTQETDFANQINQLFIQKSEVQRQLADTDANGVILISAPLTGRVESISVTPGEMVNPGDSLLQILPGNVERYVLVLWIPAHAAPYVAPGDKVNIRYEAFPPEKFGQFPGHVLSVSSVPASAREMSTYPSAPRQQDGPAETWYKVLVQPDSDGFIYRAKKLAFANGMKASCVLFLENRKMYQWMFSPLYDLKNSATGPLDATQ